MQYYLFAWFCQCGKNFTSETEFLSVSGVPLSIAKIVSSPDHTQHFTSHHHITNNLAFVPQEKKIHAKNYGDFTDSAYYLRCLDLLYVFGTEERSWQAFMKNKLFPRLGEASSCLDIGVGNGEHSQFLATQFQNMTVLDTSADSLNKIDFPCQKWHGNVLDHSLNGQSFDFINFSHVLYYIPRKITWH